MSDKLKITLLQMDIVWGNSEANAKAAEEAISANGGSDVYVLPEMWSTGFLTSPASQEIPTEDGSLAAHYENTVLITDGEPELLTLTL